MQSRCEVPRYDFTAKGLKDRFRPLTSVTIGVGFYPKMMGMESPDTRRKADDSYRALTRR